MKIDKIILRSRNIKMGVWHQFKKKSLVRGFLLKLLAEFLIGSHFEFFVGNVDRGNSVQVAPNFPAKSLSIYLNEFSLTN